DLADMLLRYLELDFPWPIETTDSQQLVGRLHVAIGEIFLEVGIEDSAGNRRPNFKTAQASVVGMGTGSQPIQLVLLLTACTFLLDLFGADAQTFLFRGRFSNGGG